MPDIQIIDPGGFTFRISTRQTETLLKAWFDEILPFCHVKGRPGIDDFDVLYPRIIVWPMWAFKGAGHFGTDPDWFCNSVVLGRAHLFRATDGESGLRELLSIRQELERELRGEYEY